jgi:hypothetical protein
MSRHFIPAWKANTVELPKTGLSENRTFSFGPEYSPIYLSKMFL